MLIQIIKPNFSYSDERGTLIQLVREGYKQFNVIESKAEVVRGGHYHKENIEVFYVISGSFSFTAKKDSIFENYTFVQGDMFLVPPFVIHEFNYTQDTLLVGMYDKGVEHTDGTKDIYTSE